jgi:phenylacetate-coenzyme A ligase PaaK-like adenylate-forming protein
VATNKKSGKKKKKAIDEKRLKKRLKGVAPPVPVYQQYANS